MEIPYRSEVPKEQTWDLTRVFKTEADWEAAFKAVKQEVKALPALEDGFTESAAVLYDRLTRIFAVDRRLSKIYVYASMASDVDTSNQKKLALNSRGQSLAAEYQAAVSFIQPAVLALGKEALDAFFKEEPRLENYRHYLEQIVKQEEHVLPAEEEKLVSAAGDALSASANTFNVLTNSDLQFPYIEDEDGEAVELTEANYDILIQSQNREVREDAFDALYAGYGQFASTFASTLAGNVKAHNFDAQTHHYQDALAAALSENNIPVDVYNQLLTSVHKHLDLLHRYVNLREEILDLKGDLQMWDMYVPITGKPSLSYTFAEAKAQAREALQVLGEDYVKHVDYLFNNRCIDYVANMHKQSGAYSGGAYDTDAYELLNWQGDLDSLYTLVHETGHSVHSMYTRENQPYVYGDYPIFVAEIASTTNENLLTNYFLDRVTDPKTRAFLLNYYLSSFKGTVYRQTQFAEFEKFIHESDQAGEALTADYLCGFYDRLNQQYYGPAISLGSDIDLEWARIPHFYYNFYVYQYATGFAAATALANKITYGSQKDKEKYLDFLKSGSSDYPINIMQKAGVDMTKSDYLEDAFKVFAERLDEFTDLIKKL